MKKGSYFFIITTVVLSITSCAETAEEKKVREGQLMQGHSNAEMLKMIEEEKKSIPVKKNSFFGVEVGEPIEKYSDVATLGRINKEDSIWEVYNIEKKGVEIGFFIPDIKNKNLVGKIYIQSEKAKSEEGIGVGTTFNELLENYPDLKILSSLAEKRVIVLGDNVQYQLNYVSNQPNLNLSEIPKTATVTEMVIGKN